MNNFLEKFNQKPVIEVCAGLIEREGKYLITQRLPGVHLELLWEFPGGKREKEESLENCLIREIDEELGLQIKIQSFTGKFVHDYSERSVAIYFFYCDFNEGQPMAKECHDFKWVCADEMNLEDFPEADVEMIQMLKNKCRTQNTHSSEEVNQGKII